jgi:dolichol-phosphate mannosyltransferase
MGYDQGMAKVVIVIPTYNERENSQKMIFALAEVLPHISKHEMHVLYVDGNSPDGTAEVIKEFQKKYKWLHLMVELKKEGLGMAYAKGMQHAMKELQADYLMEFDGDFQHPPGDIPRLVAEIDSGYDYILGSRYVPGGSIPREWGFDRKFLSVVGNLVARITLMIPHVHDVTGGFRLSKVHGFMDEFDFSHLASRSFAYKIHLMHYMVTTKGAKVKEVPFNFAHRTSGESKIVKNEMQETLRVIFKLQSQNPKILRFIKFGTVGFIGYLVNASTLFLFTRMGWAGWAAWSASTQLAIISNFTWNNLWTFKDKQITGAGKLVQKFVQFNITSAGALVIQVVVGLVTDSIIGSGYRQIVLPLTILFLILPYNYLMYTLVIWKAKAKGSNR